MRRSCLLLALFSPCLALSARYTFRPLPETGQARVTVSIDAPSSSFHMPAWAPGDYEIFHFGKKVESIEFFRSGAPVSASKRGENEWIVAGGADSVSYVVNPGRGNFSVNLRTQSKEAFASGPAVFGWFAGHADEIQELRVVGVPASHRVYTTLDLKEGSEDIRTAPNYDEFIDAPLLVGSEVRSLEFQVRGKPHFIVAYGWAGNADLAAFAQVGAKAAEQAASLFGELPYPRYIYFLDYGGGGGGLEHLNSSRIGLNARTSAQSAVGIMFHEYFHAFNVKRIRSKPLGPFDYSKPALTGALWWLEGVTDYYADVLAQRAGLIERGQFIRGISLEAAYVDGNPSHLRVSADESSRRVWEVRGSQGYGLSYYSKGKAVGLCLDLAIRGASGGRASLDDVVRKLYQECRNRQPGFEEGRIRELCIEFGGPRLGPIYDRAVMQAADLPLAEAAALAGFLRVDGVLVEDPAADAAAKGVAAGWPAALGSRGLSSGAAPAGGWVVGTAPGRLLQ